MVIFCYLLIVGALCWFLYKLYMSFSSAGGTDFAVSVYDGALYPPVLAVIGLYWVLPTYDVQWSIWIYVGIWVGITLLFAGSIRLAEELGDRPLR